MGRTPTAGSEAQAEGAKLIAIARLSDSHLRRMEVIMADLVSLPASGKRSNLRSLSVEVFLTDLQTRTSRSEEDG